MSALKLKTVTRTQGNNRPSRIGRSRQQPAGSTSRKCPSSPSVSPDGPRLEFDVCEMALSTYVCARAHGKRFTALPVFPVRAFHHHAIVCGRDTASMRLPTRASEGRRQPRLHRHDRRLGAQHPASTSTGVDLGSITWIRSGDEHVSEYAASSNVLDLEPRPGHGRARGSGELAAGVGLDPRSPGLRTLIPDASEAGWRALRDRGFIRSIM
jgi:4,5-dihydroxyphthalate decarboxylase